MYLIVGLGNPGKEYEKTRHNMGFMTIDKLSQKMNVELQKEDFKGIYGKTIFNNEKVILLKPLTYMNLSGESIIEIVNFYKIPLENIIVIYDDIDIEIGKFKIRKKGSSGTHNGMKSVIQNLGSTEFARIRVGIGKPQSNEDLANFVLKKISEDEERLFIETVDRVAEAIITIITDGIDIAMNKYN